MSIKRTFIIKEEMGAPTNDWSNLLGQLSKWAQVHEEGVTDEGSSLYVRFTKHANIVIYLDPDGNIVNVVDDE